jgi:hypothetical protein
VHKALDKKKCIKHILGMTTHSQIIDRAGGYRRVAEVLGESVERVRFWRLRNSVPAASWLSMVNKGIASLEELAVAAAQGDGSPNATTAEPAA